MKQTFKLKAVRDMIVHDIEDGSLPALHIKKGDIATVTGKGDYPNGQAYEATINGEEIFFYRFSSEYWEVVD